MQKETYSAQYEGIPDDTRLSASEALREFGEARPVTVVKRKTKVTVEYLVEFTNGARVWMHPES